MTLLATPDPGLSLWRDVRLKRMRTATDDAERYFMAVRAALSWCAGPDVEDAERVKRIEAICQEALRGPYAPKPENGVSGGQEE